MESLRALARTSHRSSALLASVEGAMFSSQPSSLGFPSSNSQSGYYPGDIDISPSEISQISQHLEQNKIPPENTRIRKRLENGDIVYEVLQASVEMTAACQKWSIAGLEGEIRLLRGDHSKELASICHRLGMAARYAASPRQKQYIELCERSFRNGSLQDYRESQKTWIKDTSPSVETIFGFVEPYRDPFGIRAEFEGLVAIADKEETRLLTRLVQESSKYIRRLPWAQGVLDNDGKGAFEKPLFEPPDFTSIHALAYCSSIIFPGINLPNYNDIRQQYGSKNIIISNRMSMESNNAQVSPFVQASQASTFQNHKYPTYYIWVVLHELLGHGTGNLMTEVDGKHNFDINNPPTNPLTQKPIDSWYRDGQTWTGVFGDLATTVDECRAELVGAYLMDDLELLRLFGYTAESDIAAQDITYNMYLQLGVDGLRGLQNYNVEVGKWGQAHSRAHFAMLKCLLTEGNGCMTIICNGKENRIVVSTDRTRIIPYGKAALGRMLLRLHMYRCTADVESCRAYYEDLSKVEGQSLEWRRLVLAQKQPEWAFVQANTFLHGDEVILREYDASPEGVIESWADRQL